MKANQIPSGSREAFFTLAHLCEPGDPIINSALASFSPSEVIEQLLVGVLRPQSKPRIAQRFSEFSLAKELDYSESIGAKFITRGEMGWPRQLDSLESEVPWVIWSLGSADFRMLSVKSLAIIGTRACTPYGRDIALRWAGELSCSGLTVVSGGALGIDIAAHSGALQTGNPTLCVLAGGVQVRYPAANEHVFNKIVDCGSILSESPPREHPRRQRFLTRNRIIAALTLGTLIVEASSRSGTVSTATRAQDMGRFVMGVPGSINSPQSEGVHTLITQKVATFAPSPHEVMRIMNLQTREISKPVTALDWRSLPQRELDVWEALPRKGGCSVEDLQTKSLRSLTEIMASLTELELKNMARSDGFLWRRT